MKEPSLVGALVLVTVGLLLVSAFPSPMAQAKIYTCANGAGCGFWWHDATWGGNSPYPVANTYVGATLEFDLSVIDSSPTGVSITIATVNLVTPWGSFSDNTLPQTALVGDDYFWYADFTIPSTATPNQYTISYTFTGTYASGTPLCYNATPANVCSGSETLVVTADPNALQAQVTSLQQTITSLQTSVTSLNSQIASLQTQQASLQSQLATAKGNITSLQASLATTSAQLATAKANLNTAQTQLTTAQASLASTQASLASVQSSLSSYSNFYLPLGVAIPSIVAALLAILYLRKKPGQQFSSSPPPPPG